MSDFPYALASDGFCIINFVGLPPPKPIPKVEEVDCDDALVSVTEAPQTQKSRSTAAAATQPLQLYGKIRSHDDEASGQCYQVNATSTTTVGSLMKMFAKVLFDNGQTETSQAQMILHHISYDNVSKFGLGDIRLPDGRVGRLLNDDNKTLVSLGIKHGDLFEMDFVYDD